ncbi:MAG TPA: hypothetical protein VLN41_01425 [Candidatus Bathyarchaeia archaeon]|nr:hypothetical protein [Candidatus Bathyarchaeia archaeon]
MFHRYQRFLAVLTVLVLVLAGGLSAQEKINPPKKLGVPGKVAFDSNAFQSGIQATAGLAPLADGMSLFGKGGQTMGFAAKSEEAKTFLIGAFYSEALAYIRANKYDLAAARLKAMEKEFVNMGVPSALYNFISKVENTVTGHKHEPAVLLDFFALFQPFFEEYLASKGSDRLILFQAGSWLTDMGLAASARNTLLLKQPDRVAYVAGEMKRMDAPKGVQDSLAEIAAISAKKDITDRDADQVLKLVKRIQSVLG